MPPLLHVDEPSDTAEDGTETETRTSVGTGSEGESSSESEHVWTSDSEEFLSEFSNDEEESDILSMCSSRSSKAYGRGEVDDQRYKKAGE